MKGLSLDCPSCGTQLIFGYEDDSALTDGDGVICVVCRALAVYYDASAPASLRRPTDDEELRLLSTPRVQDMITHVAEYHSRHGSPGPMFRPPDAGPGHPPY